ncbi:MAG: hypothetical protein RMJ67_08970 [Elusimicrobiota bacterium]|nr:hypothetical protein [Endomicrobiia bacterium]MDW8166628.1 hypothetical protein [Elusimicrobiota bacterium]
MSTIKIDARNLHYRDLNNEIHRCILQRNGFVEVVLDNVFGQRYIAAGLRKGIRVVINGTAGNDLGVFMDGSEIFVNGNAQDAVGNTMNSGKIVINGSAGDVIGYGMRGGSIYIKGNAGYRVGIHMKAYEENFPVIVVGGSVGDFLGEYMAGGIIIVLGLWEDKFPVGDFIGTGMHGGNIYIRTKTIDERLLGKEVKVSEIKQEDFNLISKYIIDFCDSFSISRNVLKENFVKLYPYSTRPYGRLYAY